MSAIEDIIKWAQGLPNWQADAVRRLLEQGELTNEDRDEIHQMVKVEAGIESECVNPVAPKLGAFSGTGTALQPIALQRISEIQHVNAVENGSTIPFGHEGITVIYGENGSGKSSYGRILKRACRARDTKEAILPNVFDNDEEGPATATIRISEGATKDIDLPWADGTDSDGRLTTVTFFDSKCARIIVDENNEAVYIPYGCEVFDSLVSLVKYVRSRLQVDQPTPTEPASASIVENTKSDIFLKNLNRNTKPDEIEDATKWEDSDEKALGALVSRIAQSGTANLLKEAQRLDTTATRTGHLSAAIKSAMTGLSNDVVNSINTHLDAIVAAEKAVTLAAEASLQNEPLPTGTSNEWKLLYKAAEEYSVKVAYPGNEFPSIDAGNLCVLCQQGLSSEARDRLQRFRAFMEDKSEQNLKSAKTNLEKATRNVGDINIPKAENFENVLSELGNEEKEMVESALNHLQEEQNRLKSVQSGAEKVAPTTPIPDIGDILTNLKSQLEKKSEQTKKDADPETLKVLEKEKDQLLSRKALCVLKPVIQEYVNQRQLEYKYDQSIRGLGTRSISEKSKEIISAGLSPQMQGDLAEELKRLNADHLPLAVNITGREGGARHQLKLNAARSAKPSDILSEGELSVVAVAGFMAELGGAPIKSPIVFDDPVSSLDHQYSRQIAQRLVDEAKERQVIVFTHNIAFLVEIEKRCAGLPLTVRTVKRVGATPGKCIEELPWEAMPVKSRLVFLDNALNDIADLHGEDDAKYNKEAAYIYDLLRESWEAFIEQDILNSTVRRHDTDVQTQRLMRVEIQDDDCARIDTGMSKCSEWMAGHDKSQALSVNRPAPKEIREDIQSLREFSKEMKGRHEDVRKRRKAILEPQSPALG